ncbi:T9SS-dependent choice-of-anchor J family protein [Chryseobacterium sp. RU37D]|uniref:T9SS-dependent choice-of-anchor J family protein n=1 Tax=Chryseobacterium sp. RU37D TaxID=1907397 RepID=UPI0009703CFB|nr:T9SS type A sorting domain-containing protein [Chryseobacterium sp. RU37D]
MKKTLLICTLACTALFTKARTTIIDESFESGNGVYFPNNWSPSSYPYSSLTGWNIVNQPATTDPLGFSGKVVVSYNTDPKSLLTSPNITLPAGSTYKLSFQIASYTGGGQISGGNHYAVCIIPGSTNYNGQTPILEETIAQDDIAIKKTIDLSSFAGQTIRICFRHFNSPNKMAILDNVILTQESVLGTSEIHADNNIGVYPNPTTDFINIKSKADILSANIYDATGRKISTHAKTSAIDVRNLQNGSYILEVETKQGKFSNKFIKKL